MSSSAGARTTTQRTQPSWSTVVGLRRVLVLASLALIVGVSSHPVLAHAETASATVRDQPQLEFTMGTVAKVAPNAVTLRFDDGQTETYNVGDATTFQTQDGGAATLQDLDVGDMAMIITADGSNTAAVIVDAGDSGFDAGGPYDIGDSEGS